MTSLRPSFHEREAFRSALSQAYADGRIDDEEFDRRATLIESCTDAESLREALHNLPQPEVEFPTTVTRAAAVSRRTAGTTAPMGRRAALAVAAAAIGFVIAGGPGHVIEMLTEAAPSQGSDEVGDSGDLLRDAAAIGTALDVVAEQEYREFVDLTLHSETLSISARSPENPQGIDRLTVTGSEIVGNDAAGQFAAGRPVFTRADIDPEVLVAMARQAPELLEGTGTTHLILGLEQGGLSAAAYVEGDRYGKGSGYVEWTADGSEIVRIVRSDS